MDKYTVLLPIVVDLVEKVTGELMITCKVASLSEGLTYLADIAITPRNRLTPLVNDN